MRDVLAAGSRQGTRRTPRKRAECAAGGRRQGVAAASYDQVPGGVEHVAERTRAAAHRVDPGVKRPHDPRVGRVECVSDCVLRGAGERAADHGCDLRTDARRQPGDGGALDGLADVAALRDRRQGRARRRAKTRRQNGAERTNDRHEDSAEDRQGEVGQLAEGALLLGVVSLLGHRHPAALVGRLLDGPSGLAAHVLRDAVGYRSGQPCALRAYALEHDVAGHLVHEADLLAVGDHHGARHVAVIGVGRVVGRAVALLWVGGHQLRGRPLRVLVEQVVRQPGDVRGHAARRLASAWRRRVDGEPGKVLSRLAREVNGKVRHQFTSSMG